MEIQIEELNNNITLFTLINKSSNIILKCISYGATITSLYLPNNNNILEEVILCPNINDLLDNNSNNNKPKYVGTIGRVANRISKGKFHLNNKEYNLIINNGENHLHGGLKGFDKKIWNYELINDENYVGVRFLLDINDMDEGYPGDLKVTAEYILTNTNNLKMKYTATTNKTTPINMTNHTFWNLSGFFRSSIKTHSLHLAYDQYLPVDSGLIPLGEPATVKDTPFDFTTTNSLGPAIEEIVHNGVHGIDHSYVYHYPNTVTNTNTDTNTDITDFHYVGTLSHEESGRKLTIHSNQLAIQIYTGNFLSNSNNNGFDENGVFDPFFQHNGICLENQGYPNAINQSNFPSILLHPGEVYNHETIYSFSTF